ncbi:porin family protein [Olivibacter jilunii]|uniref:porin family protein n=1 Tax=Olivibacter jilunii TaxID=985016 RepID=UPI0010312E2C|nr:porin family protein [Olivibacter jilunii]
MKKITLLILLMVASVAVKCQVREKNGYSIPVYSIHEPHLGFTFGIQGTSLYNTQSVDADFRLGYHLGISYSLPLSKKVSFEPQLLYSKKGAEIDELIDRYTYRSVNYKLHYLELPLKLNIHTKSIVDFVAGGYFSFLMDANYNVGTNYYYGVGELDYDKFNKMDLGLTGGIAFNLPFSKLSINYSHGFGKVIDNAGYYSYLNGARNQAIALSLTYYLR